MKNKDLKKGKESAIGKIIYGFLLFMPLLAIGGALLVSTFNMSAKTETNIVYKYESNEINTFSDLKLNNVYKLNSFDSFLDIQDIEEENYIYFTILQGSFYLSGVDTNDLIVDDGYVTCNTSATLIFTTFTNRFISSSNGALLDANIDGIYQDSLKDIIIRIEEINFSNDYNLNGILEKTDYNEIYSVETTNLNSQEVFYNAVDKVEESNLFNWSKTTIIYTGIANTCTQLGITNTFTPMLLAYWLLISVIYILYDIVLMILIILHNRVHRLQDSMS